MGVSGRHYIEGILRNTSLLVRGISMAEAQFSSMNSQGQQVLNSSCLQATMETKPLCDITHHGNSTHRLDHDSTELDKADKLLIFALETTSLRKSSDICYIEAEVFGPYSKWSCHLIPEKDITQSTTAVNKLRVKTTTEGTRVLTKNDAVVPALRYQDGLNEFYKFLCELSREQKKINPNARLILAAHKQLHQEILLQAFMKIYITSDNLNSIGVWFLQSFSFVKEKSMVGAARNKETEQPKNGIHKTKALLDSNNDKWLVNLTFAAHDQKINNSKVAGTTKIIHSPPIPSPLATPHNAIIPFDLETTGLPHTSNTRKRPIKVEELPDSQGIKRSRTDDEQSSGTSSNRPTTAQAPAISLPPPPTPHDAIILFDLQTTGLARDSDICQISAQVYGEETMWSEYLIPTNDFSPQSSCLNGFHMTVNENEETILCKNGIPVEAKSYTEGLQAFYDYLCQLSRKQKRFDPNARLVLVAHKCQTFDKQILLNAFEKINMTRDKLNALGICFADSLKILQELQQGGHLLLNYTEEEDMENGGKKLSLALANIYYRLFGEYFVEFDASEHVKAMKRVLFDPQIGVTEGFVKDRTFM